MLGGEEQSSLECFSPLSTAQSSMSMFCEVKPSDLLLQLEYILQSDSLIDEVGFIHPSQFTKLCETSGTSQSMLGGSTQAVSGVVKSQASKANLMDALFWSRDHKLGISTAVLYPLYNDAKTAFMTSRKKYNMLAKIFGNDDGLGDGKAASMKCCLDNLEREIMEHSRALLLLSCDFGTAWNSRKEIVSKKEQLLVYLDELRFSALVLSYSPKSDHGWSHRRWVIGRIAGKCSNLQEILEGESLFVKRIAEKSKMSYRAWSHRCWLVSYMPDRQVIDELINDRDWAGLHIADNSCFHYRTMLMLKLLAASRETEDSSSGVQVYQVWKEEFDSNEILIKRFIGREALWLYRRFLSLCWMKHFSANACRFSHQTCFEGGTPVHLFLETEVRLFRSCATFSDDAFEDYQSQAMFSATYMLWLMKETQKLHGVEFQMDLGQELEAVLIAVCPEKAFLLEFLI